MYEITNKGRKALVEKTLLQIPKYKKLRCQRCKHEWKYMGKSEWYTSCPKCHTSVKVSK